MTQIDTAEIRSLGKRLSANLGYGFIKEFLDNDIPAIADELDALRQQLADANKRIAELEAEVAELRKPPPDMRGWTEEERESLLEYLATQNRSAEEGD